MRIFDNEQLSAAAKKLRDAEDRYEKVWTQVRVTYATRLDPEVFWSIAARFIRIVQERLGMTHFGSSNASKMAAEELFRQNATGEHNFTFDQLLGFAHTWDELSSELHRILNDIVTDKGDDGYGDLCDSLPLAGRNAIAKLLEPAKYGIKNNAGVRAIIRSHAINDLVYVKASPWQNYIWDGENYITTVLEDAAKKWFKIESRDHKPRKEVFV